VAARAWSRTASKNAAAMSLAQQPVAILAERGRATRSVVHPEADEPAKQHAVVDLLHQESLAADAVEYCSNKARRSCSGGIDGRPMSEYIFVNAATAPRTPRRSSGESVATVVGPHAAPPGDVTEHRRRSARQVRACARSLHKRCEHG
jgi:hypothetical protein